MLCIIAKFWGQSCKADTIVNYNPNPRIAILGSSNCGEQPDEIFIAKTSTACVYTLTWTKLIARSTAQARCRFHTEAASWQQRRRRQRQQRQRPKLGLRRVGSVVTQHLVRDLIEESNENPAAAAPHLVVVIVVVVVAVQNRLSWYSFSPTMIFLTLTSRIKVFNMRDWFSKNKCSKKVS